MAKYNDYLYDDIGNAYERKNEYLKELVALQDAIDLETNDGAKKALIEKKRQHIKNKKEHPYTKKLKAFKKAEKDFKAEDRKSVV